MNTQPRPPLLTLPTDLSGEAAAQLLELLHRLVAEIEQHYGAQIHRYQHRPDERQRDLWAEHDPPF